VAMAMLCCSTGRQPKPVNMFKPETRERYIVNLVCPNRTLGLELTFLKKSQREPFIVVPVDEPAKSTEIKEGDCLVGIDNWFFDSKTSLDKVLNEVRRKMRGDQPGIRLILEREVKPLAVPETQEDVFDEKVADLPEADKSVVASIGTPQTSTVSLEKQLIAAGAEKMNNTSDAIAEEKENIPDASAPTEAEPQVDSNEMKEVGASPEASEPTKDGSNILATRQDEINSQKPPNGE